jgi:hypothetical protein
MGRDVNGNYSLPAGNPVVADTVIEPDWANTTLDDIAQSLTNSVDRLGRGGMLAALKIFDGTVTQPGLAFGNDTNSGVYRIGSDNYGLTTGGQLNVELTATGIVCRKLFASRGITDNATATKVTVTDTEVTATVPVIASRLQGVLQGTQVLNAASPSPTTDGHYARLVANYRNSGTVTGAILFRAPSSLTSTRTLLRVVGTTEFSSIDALIVFTRSGGTWTDVSVCHNGSTAPGVELRLDPDGKQCAYLGLTILTWDNLSITLEEVSAVGSGVSEAYARGWTVELVDDFTGYSAAEPVPQAARPFTAQSATALATIRNINNTGFDGTANITTAIWGTTRTLTIGGTGKSVNGSANVTWATSEIAAQTAVSWATGRTLTIGSTGKSVNGTANVTWTLGEIGAVASALIGQQALTGTSVDWTVSYKATLTRSANATLTFTAPPAGTNLSLKLVLSAGATIGWPGGVLWPGGTPPTLGNGTHFVGFYYDGTNYLGGFLETYS